MPDSVPVPWIQCQRFRVEGVVQEQEAGRPLSGVLVRVFDKDVIKDDYLGEAETDEAGRFAVQFTDADFKDTIETNAKNQEYFEIAIPRASLPPARTA